MSEEKYEIERTFGPRGIMVTISNKKTKKLVFEVWLVTTEQKKLTDKEILRVFLDMQKDVKVKKKRKPKHKSTLKWMK